MFPTLIHSFKILPSYQAKEAKQIFPSTHFNKIGFQAATSDAKIQPGNAGSLITSATPAMVLQLSVDLLFKYNPACELNTDRLEKNCEKEKKTP